MHVVNGISHQSTERSGGNMSDWSSFDGSRPGPSSDANNPQQRRRGRAPQRKQPASAQPQPHVFRVPEPPRKRLPPPQINSPRELRNRAEKQRRDNLSRSIQHLATLVPHVIHSAKKVDKTSILRLTAHYIRAHHHVFGKSKCYRHQAFTKNLAESFLEITKGFLITSTYKGLLVVVSPNIREYLGYSENELLGQSFFSIVHPEDYERLKEQLYPKSCNFTRNGELFLPNEENAAEKVAEALKYEQRAFVIRFRKRKQARSDPDEYLTCHIEGSFRKSDRGGTFVDRVLQSGRRVRAKGNNPFASGNDIVFIGVVRPVVDTFAAETRIEYYTMAYRTRHSIDGGIIQCDQRISLITGYMTSEVMGVNAMNFMHRDDVRWVVIALREMYVHHRLLGESCYRLMTKNGKFIYMKTRGCLEVDPITKQVTSFVCTNTEVPPAEGIHQIQQMKTKLTIKIINEELKNENIPLCYEVDENQELPVEDPGELEEVIYHLVDDLRSSPGVDQNDKNQEQSDIAIIPPEKKQIKTTIQKSYSIIRSLRNLKPLAVYPMDSQPMDCENNNVTEEQALIQAALQSIEEAEDQPSIETMGDDLALTLNEICEFLDKSSSKNKSTFEFAAANTTSVISNGAVSMGTLNYLSNELDIPELSFASANPNENVNDDNKNMPDADNVDGATKYHKQGSEPTPTGFLDFEVPDELKLVAENMYANMDTTDEDVEQDIRDLLLHRGVKVGSAEPKDSAETSTRCDK